MFLVRYPVGASVGQAGARRPQRQARGIEPSAGPVSTSARVAGRHATGVRHRGRKERSHFCVRPVGQGKPAAAHVRRPQQVPDSVCGRRVDCIPVRLRRRQCHLQATSGCTSGVSERLTKPNPGEVHAPEAWQPKGDTLLFTVTKEQVVSLRMLSMAKKVAMQFPGSNSYATGPMRRFHLMVDGLRTRRGSRCHIQVCLSNYSLDWDKRPTGNQCAEQSFSSVVFGRQRVGFRYW